MRKEITDELRERVIEMFCSPKKRTNKEIANELGLNDTVVGRIIRTFTAVRNRDEDEMVSVVVISETTAHFDFVTEYLGYKVSDELRKRISDALAVHYMERAGAVAKTKESADASGENLVELMRKFNDIVGTLNMIGAAVSERATEDAVTNGFKSLEKCINANFDILTQEVRKCAQFLDNIRFNTSRKRDN